MRGQLLLDEGLDVGGERRGRHTGFGTMKALTISVRTGSGLPTTAASATAG